MDEFAIRPPNNISEFCGLQEAQRRAWGIVDDSYILPISTMVSAHHHGGLVLGAFTAANVAVGLSFAFLGQIHGRICLYSQLTGVIPDHQGKRIGSRMKEAQREFCKQQGIALIAWAFDPMQAGNAYFNFHRLGACSRRYISNMYGPRTDLLNAGSDTNRLIVEWEVDATPRSELNLNEIRDLPRIIRPATSDVYPFSLDPKGHRVLLEIPTSMSKLSRDNPELARGWRDVVGHSFTCSFELGYVAVGFVRGIEDSLGGFRSYYILEREAPENFLCNLT